MSSDIIQSLFQQGTIYMQEMLTALMIELVKIVVPCALCIEAVKRIARKILSA